MIQRDYLKVVSEREAKCWFSIYPDPLPQVVALGATPVADNDPNLAPPASVAA